MEAFITTPDPASIRDPLARLLATILLWLRALLAEYQAGLLPPPPERRALLCKSPKNRKITHRAPAARHVQRPSPSRHQPPPPRAVRPHDMTAGLPRPRLVAPS